MPFSRLLSSCFNSLSDKFSTESPNKCLHMGDKTIKIYTGSAYFQSLNYIPPNTIAKEAIK